jgi:hypothetical protein
LVLIQRQLAVPQPFHTSNRLLSKSLLAINPPNIYISFSLNKKIPAGEISHQRQNAITP